MADYDRPAPSADEAAEHLRALAHATRHFQDPGETYWVLGDLGGSPAASRRSWSTSPPRT